MTVLPASLLKKLELSDLPESLELERECFPKPWSSEAISSELLRANSVCFGCFLAEGHQKLIGQVLGHVVEDELHILNISVRPRFRGQGIAQELLDRAIESGHQLGVRQAFLEVRASNVAAEKLYSSRGFKRAGVRRGYYRDNLEDALLLSYSF